MNDRSQSMPVAAGALAALAFEPHDISRGDLKARSADFAAGCECRSWRRS